MAKPIPTDDVTSTAKDVVQALTDLSIPSARDSVKRFFFDAGNGTKFLGMKMGDVFKVAKAHMNMSLREIEKLLDNAHYEARMAAVSIMDFQARDKKITEERRKALYELYLRRHDRIDNWDLVDRSAPHVVGGYLADKPRKILFALAKSKNPWERRTAIVSTWYFIRQGDVDDTFSIATLLVKDKHDLVQKAVGSWIREAGKRDKKQLLAFLDKHASAMPRTMLRYALEKLSATEKSKYMDK